MFRFPKTLDPITLFHNPTVSASNRVLQILKAASEAATNSSSSASASADQPATEALHNASAQRGEFQLDVTTSPPTTDQLKNIFDYLGAGARPAEVVTGALDVRDALKKVKGNGDGFIRPVTVDWINGKAVIGDNESEILRMVRQIPTEGTE